MSNQSYSASQYGFVLPEVTFGTVPNSSGTASVANSNAFRLTKLDPGYTRPLIVRGDKTGQASAPIGQYGRYGGQWSMACDLAGSGTAGTPPDIDAFLKATFGQSSASAGVSVTYSFTGLVQPPSLAIFDYRDPATVEQWILAGAIVQNMKIPLNADRATVEFSGEASKPISSVLFSSLTATGKAGLTAFPARPSAPVFNGTNALGFLGGITIDGTVYQSFTSGSIDVNLNRECQKDIPGFYWGLPMQGVRSITWNITLYDDDSTSLTTLKGKLGVTPVAISIPIGTTAGNIWTFSSPSVLLSPPKYSDGKRAWELQLTGTAYPSVPTANDELQLVLT